jgi:hypothetical protein
MVRASLAVSVLFAAAPNCTDLYSLATHGFVPPKLEADSVSAAPDAAGLHADVRFVATNPNPYPIPISSVDYQVSVEGQAVFEGKLDDPHLPEHGTQAVVLGARIDRSDPFYRTLHSGDTVAYVVTGTAHVDSPAGVQVDVEFQGSGTFVVPANLPAP